MVPDGPVLPDLEPFYLWPENVDAWLLFQSCSTQWREGPNGRGLDYLGVQIVIGSRPAWRERRRTRFLEVQVMERAAVQGWRERTQGAQG